MKTATPNQTPNATVDQVGRFFGFKPRRMKTIVRMSGVKPWRVGGEDVFGEDHVAALAGFDQVKSKDRGDEVRLAWRKFCGLPPMDGDELRALVGQIKNVLASVGHYELETKRLEHVEIAALKLRVDTLDRKRKPLPSITDERARA